MKKALLFAAALFATSSAFAVDFYVIGSDVNGSSWALAQADAKMTQTADGVYEWTGKTLGDGFKINDGTWDNDEWNIGMSDDGQIKLDTPYHYYAGGDSGDIKFDGFGLVNNPKVVLNLKNGTITLTGTPGEKEPVDPSEVTFYMIGSNVNGHEWELAVPDCAFTDEGNGIYRWKGEVLGSGFKVNDGTWSNPDFNIGGTGGDLYFNTPYYYKASGDSGNIAFAEFVEVNKPEIVLDINEGTLTLVSYEPSEVEAHWYIAGLNGEYVLDDTTVLSESSEGVYERQVMIEETAGKFKISDNGWAHQFGTNDPENFYIDPDNRAEGLLLEAVDGEGGDVPYELEAGSYVVIFDYNEMTVAFVDESGVKTLVAGEDNVAVYYNLHGMKVNNPDKGIFVKVVNGKAVKVVK